MKKFQKIQYAFIDHLKNPDINTFDHGIENRRMQVYRELFFNNVLGFLSSGFPVLESLYTEAAWQALARKFFAEHQSRSPYFIDISKEFVEYLSDAYDCGENDPPFMSELAHYEWMELAISVRKKSHTRPFWDGEEPFTRVQFSELASLLSYQFPVHQISLNNQPQQSSEPVYLVVYRNEQDEVNFTLVNAVSAHMLNVIQQNDIIRVADLNSAMLKALPQLDPKQVKEGVQHTLEQMLAQQILLPG
ncbi:MAG: hypothetical protein ACI965_002050 [Paraglaciecola sp.]|jgi:hypothetical protein